MEAKHLEFIFLLFIVPLLGVLWVINLFMFIKKIHAKKSTHNQTVLGIALTFGFIFAQMYSFLMLLG